jgi:hypothetical protein
MRTGLLGYYMGLGLYEGWGYIRTGVILGLELYGTGVVMRTGVI